MKRRILSIILLLALAIPAWAGPAPWYLWRSRSSGEVVCSQTTPGTGWVKESGPYSDIRCTTKAKPNPTIGGVTVPRQ